MPPQEKPIIFNSEMIRAILDGRKTMTRRIIKEPFEIHANGYITRPRGNERLCPYECPYGKPGDRLWVRETWAFVGGGDPGLLITRADYPDCVPAQYENLLPIDKIKWKPSIHMPRWASRITLEVTDVKVERVQDITIADIKSEGAPDFGNSPHSESHELAVWFHDLWSSINGKRGFGWDKNPLLWIIKFKKI